MTVLQSGITGSLPKPKWLSDPSAQLRADWMVADDALGEAHDDAVRLAIADQVNAGLDIAAGKDDWGIYFRIGESF